MVQILNTPLDVGKEIQLARKTVTEAIAESYEFVCDSESVLIYSAP